MTEVCIVLGIFIPFLIYVVWSATASQARVSARYNVVDSYMAMPLSAPEHRVAHFFKQCGVFQSGVSCRADVLAASRASGLLEADASKIFDSIYEPRGYASR